MHDLQISGIHREALQVAVAAVADAAQLCTAVQRELTPQALEKKDRSPVTVADFGSQALICRALGDRFAADPIVAEEDSAALAEPAGQALAEGLLGYVRRVRPEADLAQTCAWIDRGGAPGAGARFWTLDPIDGTKGFLRGDQYAIALALIIEGAVTVAVLGCPNLPLEPPRADARGVLF